jgi:chromosome segregation ATPase
LTFPEASAAIDANFREAFLTLFGGDTSEIRLTDESGIDIALA